MRSDQSPEEEITSFLGGEDSHYTLIRFKVERLRDPSSLVSQLFTQPESGKMAVFLITDHLLDDPLYPDLLNAFAQQLPLSLFATHFNLSAPASPAKFIFACRRPLPQCYLTQALTQVDVRARKGSCKVAAYETLIELTSFEGPASEFEEVHRKVREVMAASVWRQIQIK